MNPQTKRQELAGLESYLLLRRSDVIQLANKVLAQAHKCWDRASMKIDLVYFNQLKDSIDHMHRLETRIASLKQMIQVAEEEIQRALAKQPTLTPEKDTP